MRLSGLVMITDISCLCYVDEINMFFFKFEL